MRRAFQSVVMICTRNAVAPSSESVALQLSQQRPCCASLWSICAHNPGAMHKHHAPSNCLLRSVASTATQPATAAPDNSQGLTIHPSAVQRLKQLRVQNPGKDVSLRIEVEGGGCSGFQYKFSLDNAQPSSTDKVFEADGARVVCDPDSYEMLQGSIVQFEDTLIKRAFVVASNPNSEASCGCGSSFTAKLPPITRPKA